MNFLKVTSRGPIEVIVEIVVDNRMSFEGVKIPVRQMIMYLQKSTLLKENWLSNI